MATQAREHSSPTRGKKQGGRTAKQRGPALEERDELYGVISVLYHALQGAETYEEYVEDAEEAGDEELVSFFEEAREEELARAETAKQLLFSRLARGGSDQDRVGS
jgi:hypothetical protein